VTRRFCLVGLICAVVAAIAPCCAYANFGFAPGSASFQVLDALGQPDSLAGAHPDHVDIQFAFNTVGEAADGNVKDIVIELPPGLTGDAGAVPQCPRQVFDSGFEEKECPPESQVGVATLSLAGLEEITVPVFDIRPAPDQLAELGEGLIAKFPMEMKLGPDGSGAMLEQSDITQGIPLTGIRTELWGVPADHQEGTGLERHAFLTTPTRCDGTPLDITIRARSWQEPKVWHVVSANTGTPLTGCSALRFEPNMDLTLSNPIQDEPTGLQANISNPTTDDPDGLVSASVESIRMALPGGVSVSPSGLESVAICTDTRFALRSTQPPDCPASSRVGTAEVESTVLRSPLLGDVFLGEEQPGGAFRLLVSTQGFGTVLKLAGELRLDERTGRLNVVLGSLPQSPFSRVALQLFGGPRALLATPLSCGPSTADATFASYSGAPVVTRSDLIDIKQGGGGIECPKAPPFAPDFIAGTTGISAGEATSLVMNLRRHPGEQSVSNVVVTLPMGLTAALGSVEPCSAPDASLGRCTVASRIGSVIADVGSGPEPATLSGEAFLTAPYHGAPFGIAIVFQGVIGPFDAGTLVSRGTVNVRPLSGQLVISMDSLPGTIQGISIRLRSMSLNIDRQGFIRNPTSCARMSVESVVGSVGGLQASSNVPFAVNKCNSLRFRPLISMALTGPDQIDRGRRPGLFLTLRSQRRSTNLRSLDLPLPEGLRVDVAGLQEICARGEAIADRCTVGSRVGTAIARSPLLRGPLDGAVYAVQPHKDGLPDLWMNLEGDGLRLVVRAKTFLKHGRLNTQLVGLPDMPLSYFNMRLPQARRGLFALNGSLCRGGRARRIVSTAALEGQDHAYRFVKVKIRHPSCKKVVRQGTERE
jgi:hypothetical protein